MCAIKKTFAPVVIPTLCRYEHFKRCVLSLARCTFADRTELVIGLDYPAKESHHEGYEKIKAFLPHLTGFAKVTVLEAKENLGAIGNTLAIRKYAFSKYDRYIYSEDDNEFSPCFLDFMNQALDRYEDNECVTSVCAYTNPQYTTEEMSGNVIFIYDSSAWGVGLWKRKEESYDQSYQDFLSKAGEISIQFRLLNYYPMLLRSILEMLSSGNYFGDARRSALNVMNDTFQVRPYRSMVRNWGHDGSGLHCGVQKGKFEKAELISEKTFAIQDDDHVIRTKMLDRVVSKNMMPKKKINKMKIYFGILYKMIKYQLS